MIKRLLKQTSLVAFSFTCLVSLNQMTQSGVAYAFFSDTQSLEDIAGVAWDISENGGKWSFIGDMIGAANMASSAAETASAATSMVNKFSSQAKQAISGAKSSAESAQKGLMGAASTFSSDAVNAATDGLSQDIQQKAKDLATGAEAARLLNERVTSEMKEIGQKTNAEGGGLPTIDAANTMVGMFNLDSVFGGNLANGGIRNQDTKGCSLMGISGAARGRGLGLECCEKWAMSANEDGADSGFMGILGPVSPKVVCCALSPEYCLSALDIAKEKAGCLNGALGAGGKIDAAWKTCAVECGKKGYGELVHNADGTYDPAQIDELMKECYNGSEKKWQPSPTVLTASELAPVVPEEIKVLLK